MRRFRTGCFAHSLTKRVGDDREGRSETDIHDRSTRCNRAVAALRSAGYLFLAASVCLSACTSGGNASSYGSGKSGKLLVIGIDAGTWELIDPLVREGRMPNFRKLREQGASGTLQSITPTISPIIWTAIATGRKPVDHGIRGFVKNEEDGEQIQFTNLDRKVKAVWNILSDRDRRVNVVGWFTSYPADIVKGAFISDRNEGPLPGGSSPPSLESMLARTARAYSPEEVRRRVEPFYGGSVDESKLAAEEVHTYKRYEETLEHYFKVDNLRLEWTLELLRGEPADFTAVFFKGTDPMAHLTWAYMDPEPFRSFFTPRPEAIRRFGGLIPRYYELVDGFVGRLVAAAPSDMDVIVVSDHGCGPTKELLAYHVNPLLARLGWVHADKEGHPDVRNSIVIDPTPMGGEGRARRRLTLNRHLLAERATSDGERERLLNEVRSQLETLRTSQGEPLFKEVRLAGGGGRRRDRVDEDAPRYAIDVEVNDRFSEMRRTDRGLEVSGEYTVGVKRYPLSDLVSVRWERTGGHKLNGIVLMVGPRIRQGAHIEGATIYDIAPTMLRLLGLPPSRQMEGRALEEALRPDLLPPPGKPIKTYETGETIQHVEAPPMPEIEEEMERRLRTLGYIQ